MTLFQISALQNVSNWSGEEPSIKISVGDSDWNEALSNWRAGKNPTNSPEWKKAVVATFKKWIKK